MNYWFCVSLSSTKQPLYLCHTSDPRSLDQLETTNHLVDCNILYIQAVSCAKNMCCVTQQHDTCSKRVTSYTAQAVKEMLCNACPSCGLGTGLFYPSPDTSGTASPDSTDATGSRVRRPQTATATACLSHSHRPEHQTPGELICDDSDTTRCRLDSASAQAPTRRRCRPRRTNIYYNINPKSELPHILTQTPRHARVYTDGNSKRGLAWFSGGWSFGFPRKCVRFNSLSTFLKQSNTV